MPEFPVRRNALLLAAAMAMQSAALQLVAATEGDAARAPIAGGDDAGHGLPRDAVAGRHQDRVPPVRLRRRERGHVGDGIGHKISKSSSGYQLKHLFMGHQGTLGICTEMGCSSKGRTSGTAGAVTRGCRWAALGSVRDGG